MKSAFYNCFSEGICVLKKKTLEHFSKRRLALIEWRPTVKNNIEVLAMFALDSDIC